MKEYLFVYGTLKDDEQVDALLGYIPNKQIGEIKDKKVATAEDGYKFLTKDEGSIVKGNVLTINEEDFQLIDQWEEVPKYIRNKIKVQLAKGEELDCWYYNRETDLDNIDSDKQNSDKSDNILQMKKLNEQYKANDKLSGDTYILFPVSFESDEEKKPENTMFSEKFIARTLGIMKQEYDSEFVAGFKKIYLGSFQIFISYDGVSYDQNSEVFVLKHSETNLGVLSIAIPCTSIPLNLIANEVSTLNFWLIGKNEIPRRKIIDFIKDNKLKDCGEAKIAFFLNKMPTDSHLLELLCGEKIDGDSKILDNDQTSLLKKNLAQYDSAKIFCSEKVLIEVPKTFNSNFLDLELGNDRIKNQILTLFVVELLLLQEASLNRSKKFINEFIKSNLIEENNHKNKLGTKDILDMNKEFSSTLTFWDVRHFNYLNARYLSKGISESFRICDLKVEFEYFKNIFEQLLARNHEIELEEDNENMSYFLTTLAILGLIPGILWFFETIESGKIKLYPSWITIVITIIIIVSFNKIMSGIKLGLNKFKKNI